MGCHLSTLSSSCYAQHCLCQSHLLQILQIPLSVLSLLFSLSSLSYFLLFSLSSSLSYFLLFSLSSSLSSSVSPLVSFLFSPSSSLFSLSPLLSLHFSLFSSLSPLLSLLFSLSSSLSTLLSLLFPLSSIVLTTLCWFSQLILFGSAMAGSIWPGGVCLRMEIYVKLTVSLQKPYICLALHM